MLLRYRRKRQNEGCRSWYHASKGSRLLFFCAVLAVLVVVLPTGVACARTLSPEPSGGGLVENPDHTWTFYANGHVVKVYSSAERKRSTVCGTRRNLTLSPVVRRAGK